MATINVTVNKIKLDPEDATGADNIMRVEFGYTAVSGGGRSLMDRIKVGQPALFTVADWELAIRAALTAFATSRGHTINRITYIAFINNIISL